MAEVTPPVIPARPSNPVELAAYDVGYAWSRIERSAKGRRDQLNPKLALVAIAEMEARLAALRTVCEAEVSLRDAQFKAETAERKVFERRRATLARQAVRKAQREAARLQRAADKGAALIAAKTPVEVPAPVVEAVAEQPSNVITMTPKSASKKGPSILGRLFKREAA